MESLHENLKSLVSIDLTKAHPNFSYPHFSNLGNNDNFQQTLQNMIYPKHADQVLLFKNYFSALEERIKNLPEPAKKIACLEYPTKEIYSLSRKHGFELIVISRDPDMWDFSALKDTQ